MLKITGYSDEISVKAADTVNFMVNCEHAKYTADIVRIVSGDLNPEGPGIVEEVIETSVSGVYEGRPQTIHAGSFAMIDSDGRSPYK